MNALAQRNLVNLGLLAAVLGLAVLLFWQPELEATSPLLPTLDAAQVQRIQVTRQQRETLEFVRQGGQWRMTAPYSGWANPVLLKRLLEITARHCPRQYALSELDRAALHLDPPLLRLQLNDQPISFGTTTALDGMRYLQIGATVQICPDHWYALLDSAAASFLAPVWETRKPDSSEIE